MPERHGSAVEVVADAIAGWTPSNWPGDESEVTSEEHEQAARAVLAALVEDAKAGDDHVDYHDHCVRIGARVMEALRQ